MVEGVAKDGGNAVDTHGHLAYLFAHSYPELFAVQRSQRLKILFTSTHRTSFIEEDLKILRNHFDVRHLLTTGVLAPGRIATALPACDVTFTWFASVYSFFVVLFARMWRKPSMIIIGGVDASKEPEINYGIWLSPWKSVLVRWAMRNASKLLVVDPFFTTQVKRLAGVDGSTIEYVPTGYDDSVWHPAGPKEPLVLTVAACHDERRMKTKGIDILFAAAAHLPATPFVVIGIFPSLLEKAKRQAPPNVTLIPFVERNELLTYYQRAKVYCQPSYTEGLPNSLCEAMLCECIPVGTNVGGIPTAIADKRFLVRYGDVEGLAHALRTALAEKETAGRAARSFIAENFPLKKREESLLRIIHGLTT